MTANTGRSRATRVILTAVALALFVGLAALGTWQVQRRTWKLALIERVEQRVRASPVVAPAKPQWPSVTAETDEYRHVTLTGTFAGKADIFVQAVTELGAGFWVMTPLRLPDQTFVFINRGFVPSERRDSARRDADRTAGAVTVTGLLRVSEPGGGFLRRNDTDANRWFSRDVPAMAAAMGLRDVAPYFIDVESNAADRKLTANPNAKADEPIPGLTVITFHNSHLVYAITWYALALMVAWAAWHLWRPEKGDDATQK